MALVIAAIRQRNAGADVVVRDKATGREVELNRHGYDGKESDEDLLAWCEAEVAWTDEQRAAVAAERDAERAEVVAEVGKADFKRWLVNNAGREDVQKALAPLVRSKRVETGALEAAAIEAVR